MNRPSIEHDEDLSYEIHLLLKDDLRGQALKSRVDAIFQESSIPLSEVLRWVLDRKNPAKIGKSIVNKVWPDLIPTQEYMGAIPGDLAGTGHHPVFHRNLE